MSSLRFLVVLAAAAVAAALPLGRRNDPHEADFRTFGVAGCSDQNEGVYTLTQSQIGQCRPFVDSIGSLLVVDDTCTLTVFQDSSCAQEPVVVPVGICQNGSWQSYRLTC